MTQAELNRAVASATGESIATICRRGFSLVEAPDVEPLVVDWEQLEAERVGLFPDITRRHAAAA